MVLFTLYLFGITLKLLLPSSTSTIHSNLVRNDRQRVAKRHTPVPACVWEQTEQGSCEGLVAGSFPDLSNPSLTGLYS